MRFILKVKIPMDAGNEMVKDPKLGEKIQGILEDIKAEAAYFTEEDGLRTFYVIVQIQDPSEIPNVAEPFFLGFNAPVEFHPAMVAEDLAKAGPSIAKWVKRFG